jgi:small GTP-binding protein
MSKPETNDYNINIAIIGPISAGKSTLLNCLFVNQYSDMKIKRTTMTPQIYHELHTKSFHDINLKKIKKNNSKINNRLIAKSEKNEEIQMDDIKEVNYYVPPLYDFIKNKNNVNLIIHDIPGLNDGRTKDLYFNYVKKNFNKYDIIIFVIDINSSMNTSDEKDILEMILNNCKKNKGNGITSKLIIIINKCDNMFLENDKLIMDNEYNEMFEQAEKMISQKVGEIIPSLEYNIIPLSSEDSYLYRMFNRNPEADLDVKYINKFGDNEFGKKVWNRYNISEKREKIKKYMNNINIEESLKFTGFNEFKNIFNKTLSNESQYKMLMNHNIFKIKMLPIPNHIEYDFTGLEKIWIESKKINTMIGNNENDANGPLSNIALHIFVFIETYDKHLKINYEKLKEEGYHEKTEYYNTTLCLLEKYKKLSAFFDFNNKIIYNTFVNKILDYLKNYYINCFHNPVENDATFDQIPTMINEFIINKWELDFNIIKKIYLEIYIVSTINIPTIKIINEMNKYFVNNLCSKKELIDIVKNILINKYKSILHGKYSGDISKEYISSYAFLCVKYWDSKINNFDEFVKNYYDISYYSNMMFKNIINTDTKLISKKSLELEYFYVSIIENKHLQNEVKNNSKTSVNASMRRSVWNKYIGQGSGLVKCFCCKDKDITPFDFECGHITAVSMGGATNIENLRPICSLCNKSMGSKNMFSFMDENNYN